jgi:hypothetical protein
MPLSLEFKSLASAEAVCRAIGDSTRAGAEASESGRVVSLFVGRHFELRYADPGGGRQDPKPIARGVVTPSPDGRSEVTARIGSGVAAPAGGVGIFVVFGLLSLVYSLGAALGFLLIACGLGLFYAHRERNISLEDRDVRRLAEGLEAAIKAADAGV